MDFADLSRIFLAFIAVVGFIGLAALAVRRLGLAAGVKSLAKQRRISVVESLPVDARRRAVIIRCDGREHLVLLGQTGETLIDANLPPRSANETEATNTAPAPFAEALAKLSRPRAPAPVQSANDADAA